MAAITKGVDKVTVAGPGTTTTYVKSPQAWLASHTTQHCWRGYLWGEKQKKPLTGLRSTILSRAIQRHINMQSLGDNGAYFAKFQIWGRRTSPSRCSFVSNPVPSLHDFLVGSIGRRL